MGDLLSRPAAARPRLRELLARPEPLVAPGAYDALSARLVEQAGFDVVYMTGFGTTASPGGYSMLSGLLAEVNLSELTVRNHRCRIMAKLGLRTSAELISYAFEKGFVRTRTARGKTARS